MNLAERASRLCAVANCERTTDWPTPPSVAKFCRGCTAEFLRTGVLPVIPPKPAWLKRLVARDLTGAILGGGKAA